MQGGEVLADRPVVVLADHRRLAGVHVQFEVGQLLLLRLAGGYQPLNLGQGFGRVGVAGQDGQRRLERLGGGRVFLVVQRLAAVGYQLLVVLLPLGPVLLGPGVDAGRRLRGHQSLDRVAVVGEEGQRRVERLLGLRVTLLGQRLLALVHQAVELLPLLRLLLPLLQGEELFLELPVFFLQLLPRRVSVLRPLLHDGAGSAGFCRITRTVPPMPAPRSSKVAAPARSSVLSRGAVRVTG